MRGCKRYSDGLPFSGVARFCLRPSFPLVRRLRFPGTSKLLIDARREPRKRFISIVSVLVIMVMLEAAPVRAAEDLLELSQLARGGGAPTLALRLMDRRQPDLNANPQAWVRWERERVYILESIRDWTGIVQRLERPPAGLPEAFYVWAREAMARADLARDNGGSARRRLAALIWNTPEQLRADRLAHWRRMLIRAYLMEDRPTDAYTAALRYVLDYGDGDAEWRRLQAKVLIRVDRPTDAASLLEDGASPEGRVLSLIARNRAGLLPNASLRSEAMPLLGGGDLNPDLRFQLWTGLAQSAARVGDVGAQVKALEEAMAERGRARWSDAPVRSGPEDLWHAYLAYARSLANDRQLLVGSYPPWLDYAADLAPAQPLKARSLYAYVALNGGSGELMEQGHAGLVGLLSRDERGQDILHQLYLESDRYPAVRELPAVARYVLADQAIAKADVALASRLLAGLDEPPEGTRTLDWQLRRARVFVLGGQVSQGVGLLRDVVAGSPSLEAEEGDRINQVLFDLQTIGEHATAYALFSMLLEKVDDPRLRREVLYWMADSQAALKNDLLAARLYLQSAMLPGPHNMDPWAQTARFQAAESLSAAGLYADARNIYTTLESVTKDPARRAALGRAIQQLPGGGLMGDLRP